MKRDIFRFIAISIIITIIIALTGYASGWIIMTPEVSKSKSESRKLLTIEPNDIESMKIVFWKSEIERNNPALRGKTIDKDTIAGLLTLLKKANNQYDLPTTGFMILKDFDYILQVKLKNGDSIEVPYVTTFDWPFGDFRSESIKAALYSLTDPIRGNIILFNAGKVIEVMGFNATTNPGGSYGLPVRGLIPPYYTSIHLNKEGQIILDLQLKKDGQVIIQDSRPVKYGDVLSYDYGEQGYLILDIFYPSYKRG